MLRRNMAEEISAKYLTDRRAEPRQSSERFHSVEMKLASLPIYLFKLKNVSANGACFTVKEGSAILKHLKVGQILNMRYHAEDEMKPSEVFKSEIKYITKALEKPYKGHYLIGIIVREKQNQMDLQDDI
jgi:hypothetical protein